MTCRSRIKIMGLKSSMPVCGITRRIGISSGLTNRSTIARMGWYGDMKNDRMTCASTNKVMTLNNTSKKTKMKFNCIPSSQA